MRVVVPFAADRPKTRLAAVLTSAERIVFSRAMLADVLDALLATGHDPEVLATASLEGQPARTANGGAAESATPSAASSTSTAVSPPIPSVPSVPVRIDDRALTPAINAVLEASDEPVAVVMADLALVTPAALSRLFDADESVVLAPGRGGGTNALLARHPDFRVDYHGTSYLDHRSQARRVGASVEPIDSARLATDIDEPADLPEVLIHAENRSSRWLRAAGFSLAVGDGRVGIERTDNG